MTHSPLVILRRTYLELTKDFCAAKLIEYFKHWREWKIKAHRSEWVYMPLRQIHEDLMCEHSLHVIRRARNILIDMGILEDRPNPGNGQDRTKQYRLNTEVLELLLIEHGTGKEEHGTLRKEQSYTQNLSKDIESTTAPLKAAAALEKLNEPIQEQPGDASFSPEQVEDVCTAMQRVSPLVEINPQLKKQILLYWANVPQAIAHLKKAVTENWQVRSLTAVFVGALKRPDLLDETAKEPEPSQSKSGMPQEIDPPTIEQMIELQAALDRGEIHDIHLSSDGITKIIKLDRFTQVPWHEYLEELKHEHRRKN